MQLKFPDFCFVFYRNQEGVSKVKIFIADIYNSQSL